MSEPIVSMRGIRKSFGRVDALCGVDLEVGRGEVLGLIGDNGAGKSTLIKILTGVFPPDAGEIRFDGRPVAFKSPAEARAAGIETVYQGSGVVNLMNIGRNFFLGREPRKKGVPVIRALDCPLMARECESVMKRIGVHVRSASDPTAVLSGGERQSINIGRAMYFKAKLIVLDEPTTALSIKEQERVLDFVSEVRSKGTSVIFIAHNLYHVFRVSDRFVILNLGRKEGDYRKEDIDVERLTDVAMRLAERA
jgi:simple sugar transport system ATP-binding protein